LKDVGHEISEATYFREKKKIEEMKFERMQHIALYFQDQHLERIDKCELVEKLMWENYRAGDLKRVKILETIISIQPYISGYYDATRYVLEKRIKTETDIGRANNPYVSINLKKRREKEIDKEAEDRRLASEATWLDNDSYDPDVPPIV
jgi:hypothetical protein